MRILLLSLISFMLVSTACVNEEIVAELPANFLTENGPSPFTLIEVERSQRGPTRVDVVVKFASVFDELHPQQQEKITNILVQGSRFGEITVAPAATEFAAESLRTEVQKCFELKFITLDGGASRASELCFIP